MSVVKLPQGQASTLIEKYNNSKSWEDLKVVLEFTCSNDLYYKGLNSIIENINPHNSSLINGIYSFFFCEKQFYNFSTFLKNYSDELSPSSKEQFDKLTFLTDKLLKEENEEKLKLVNTKIGINNEKLSSFFKVPFFEKDEVLYEACKDVDLTIDSIDKGYNKKIKQKTNYQIDIQNQELSDSLYHLMILIYNSSLLEDNKKFVIISYLSIYLRHSEGGKLIERLIDNNIDAFDKMEVIDFLRSSSFYENYWVSELVLSENDGREIKIDGSVNYLKALFQESLIKDLESGLILDAKNRVVISSSKIRYDFDQLERLIIDGSLSPNLQFSEVFDKLVMQIQSSPIDSCLLDSGMYDWISYRNEYKNLDILDLSYLEICSFFSYHSDHILTPLCFAMNDCEVEEKDFAESRLSTFILSIRSLIDGGYINLASSYFVIGIMGQVFWLNKTDTKSFRVFLLLSKGLFVKDNGRLKDIKYSILWVEAILTNLSDDEYQPTLIELKNIVIGFKQDNLNIFKEEESPTLSFSRLPNELSKSTLDNLDDKSKSLYDTIKFQYSAYLGQKRTTEGLDPNIYNTSISPESYATFMHPVMILVEYLGAKGFRNFTEVKAGFKTGLNAGLIKMHQHNKIIESDEYINLLKNSGQNKEFFQERLGSYRNNIMHSKGSEGKISESSYNECIRVVPFIVEFLLKMNNFRGNK